MAGYDFAHLSLQFNSDTKDQFFSAMQLGPDDWPHIAKSEDISNANQKKREKVRKELDSSLAREGWTTIPDPGGILTNPWHSYLSRPVPPGAPPQEYETCVSQEDHSGGSQRLRYYQLTPDQLVFLDAGDHEAMDEVIARLNSQGWVRLDFHGYYLKKPIQAQATAPVPAPASPAAAPAASQTPSARDPVETLKKLAELRGAGVVTEEEFQAKKKELLAEL